MDETENNKKNHKSYPYGALVGSRKKSVARGNFYIIYALYFHKSATWAICSMFRMYFNLLFTSPFSSGYEDDGVVLISRNFWRTWSSCGRKPERTMLLGCCHANLIFSELSGKPIPTFSKPE